MTQLKKRIITEIEALDNPRILHDLFDFIRLLGRNTLSPKSNRDAVLALAGTVNDEDAAEMRLTMEQEFNSIEGEW